ncbi:MAG: hypothetical protein Q8885_02530 [Candidatus Phytoplasma stylosanthis]|nr:hypothetical protein [Candidatus Phytoplasma stylosanthis]
MSSTISVIGPWERGLWGPKRVKNEFFTLFTLNELKIYNFNFHYLNKTKYFTIQTIKLSQAVEKIQNMIPMLFLWDICQACCSYNLLVYRRIFTSKKVKLETDYSFMTTDNTTVAKVKPSIVLLIGPLQKLGDTLTNLNK